MMTTQEKLQRIQNRTTQYELIAIKGETRILIGYCAKTRPGLLGMCRKNGQAVVDLCCPTGAENLMFGKKAAAGATIGEWVVRFTGRTQRDAILEGELPFVVDAVVAQVA